ncbi:Bulb-type lectin domain containing protein [Pseudohyphozyma bogoriensis]|nr:Bulb-type lectin domain containing protein [Pseudohyphozyma bogoriensis]
MRSLTCSQLPRLYRATATQTHIFHPLPHGQDNGAAITALYASSGPSTTVLLLPATLYILHTPITLTTGSTLATLGYPLFSSGQQAILETRGEKEAGAVHMFNLKETALKRVHIRGCRGWGAKKPESQEEVDRLKKEGKLGWIEGGGALVWMGGGESEDQVVEGCRLEDPRGWTSVHLCDFANRGRILDCIVGPCGQQASGGPWADGLSIAGKNSVITGNTIIDATDGAIVIFCAPGSIVANNTIIARERDLLGAINLVDDFPFEQDFTGTTVVGNTIRTEGAYIRLGIGIGSTCWSPWQEWHKKNRGGSVYSNYIGPGTIGYGIGVSSAKDFTVLGNVVLEGTSFEGDMGHFNGVRNAAPTGFLKTSSRNENCKLQDDFVEGEASWLIGIEPGWGKYLDYWPGQLQLFPSGHSNSGEGGLKVKSGVWGLGKDGVIRLRDHKTGKPIWSSAAKGHWKGSKEPVLEFGLDGVFAVKDGEGGKVVWDPTEYLVPYLPPHDGGKDVGKSIVVFGGEEPFITIKDGGGNSLYSTLFEFGVGWELHAGEWVSVTPLPFRGVLGGDGVEGFAGGEGGAPHSQPTAPPIPEHSRPHFRSFVKDLATELLRPERDQTCPAPPHQTSPTQPLFDNDLQHHSFTPTFLYMNPHTAQLVLHSSSSPSQPDPAKTHWVSNGPVDADSAWFVFQGDGNAVIYAKKGDNVFVPWASGTNGEGKDRKILLKGVGEEGGPAIQLSESGRITWSSK